ncbi:MAG TPA: N-acetyltransferase [Lacipirellulaceae bacterium]|nr:N-acetyltransferase [Lacipirellulaceae bacterium]
MPHFEVVPVTSRRERQLFFNLPWDLYRGDPHWVPPLRIVQKELLNFKHHPFYDDAEICNFLALADGKPAGRIAAIVNHAHNRQYHEQRGFFGFFESVDDVEVSGRLFDAARAWLKERGIEAIRGPANPSLNYEVGLLIEGFNESPWFMMTYNKPYYARLVDDYGFRLAQNLYAFWGHLDMLEEVTRRLDSLSKSVVDRFQLHCRPMNVKRFDEEIRTFLEIYNRSLVNTWGFVPMSPGEVKKQAVGMKRMIVPELTTVAEVDGKPVGTMFGLLDFNPRIKEIDGRLFPFGFLKLLRNRKALNRVRLISTNVLPEYQNWGVGIALVARLVPDALAWGIQEAEFSWVLESNDLSFKTLKKGGAKISKRYRVYDYGPPDTTANAKFMPPA